MLSVDIGIDEAGEIPRQQQANRKENEKNKANMVINDFLEHAFKVAPWIK